MTVRRSRHGQISLNVDVDIYVDEVLEELSDDDLIEEAARRKLEARITNKVKAEGDPLEMLDEVLDALRRKDSDEALFLLERILHPKFHSLKLCEAEFKKALPPPSPATTADQ